MQLPTRNRSSKPLTLFIEPYCDEFEIAPDAEAIITLTDGAPHSLDFHSESCVSLWDEGERPAVVEVVSKEQNAVVNALNFGRGWLHHFGAEGKTAVTDIDEAVARAEESHGYLAARFSAYRAFRDGFRLKQSDAEPRDAALPEWSGEPVLASVYRAGALAAVFNHRVRIEPNLIELGTPPFDTDTAREMFERADGIAGSR